MGAPNDGALLWNNAKGTPELVPQGDVPGALASGKYQSYSGDTRQTTTSPAGGTIARPVGQVAPEGERPADTSGADATFRREARADSLSDPWVTFAEAALDVGTLGIVHERGEKADIRRGQDTRAALLGGFLGMVSPAASFVGGAGRAAGATAARALLGGAEGIAGRAIAEAGAGAAIMGAISTGQQASDAVLTNSKFSAEAVLSSVKLGAIVGGAFGAAGGVISKSGILERLPAAGRGAIAEQGGILDPTSPESARVHTAARDAIGTLDTALDDLRRQAGAARVLASADPSLVPEGSMERVDAALRTAEGTSKRLAGFDVEAVLRGEDMGLRGQFQDALDAHQRAVIGVDEAFGPRLGEVRGGSWEYGEPIGTHVPPEHIEALRAGDRAHQKFGLELPDESQPIDLGPNVHRMDARVVDALMGPEERAAYEAHYGHPYEEYADAFKRVHGHEPGAAPLTGEENLGGHVTPTSDGATNPGSGRARPAPAPEPPPATPELEPGLTRLNEAIRARRPAGAPPGLNRFDRFEIGPSGNAFAQDLEMSGSGAGRTVPSPAPVAEVPAPEVAPKVQEIPGVTGEMPAQRPTPDPNRPAPVSEVPRPAYEARGVRPSGPELGESTKRLVDEIWRNRQMNPRPTALDRAAAKMSGITDEIRTASGGKLDAAAALDHLRNEGHAPATNALGEQLDQVIAARRIGRAVADESRGVETPLREAGRRGVLSWLGSRTVSSTVRRAMGGALGWTVGGPVGGVLGTVFARRLFGTVGRVAGASGRVATASKSAVGALLGGTGKYVAVGAGEATRPVYDPAGHEPDVAKRAAQITALAASPQAVTARVTAALGDAALLHPEHARNLIDLSQRQLQNLSVRVPVFMLDALGRQRPAEERAVRRFEEYENATFDLDGVLGDFATGKLTGVRAEALREQFPEVRNRLVAEALADIESVRRLPSDRLQYIERTLAVPLTTTDPAFTARQQIAWGPPSGPMSGPGPVPPAPTPAQGGVRAPGN